MVEKLRTPPRTAEALDSLDSLQGEIAALRAAQEATKQRHQAELVEQVTPPPISLPFQGLRLCPTALIAGLACRAAAGSVLCRDDGSTICKHIAVGALRAHDCGAKAA